MVNLENNVIPLRVMNITDRPQVFYKDWLVYMCKPVSFSQQNLSNVNVDNLQIKEISVTLPDHLKQMFENSSENLTSTEKHILRDLLLEQEQALAKILKI